MSNFTYIKFKGKYYMWTVSQKIPYNREKHSKYNIILIQYFFILDSRLIFKVNNTDCLDLKLKI